MPGGNGKIKIRAMKIVLCVGAGLTGSVIARKLADQGVGVTVIEERGHIAGNCFTHRDPGTGIMVHAFGPHIFHTSDRKTWDYVNRFAEFSPWVNRVKAVARGRVYSLPVNLLTINQFFGKTFSPREAKDFIEHHLAEKDTRGPESFEEEALSGIGRELYEAFFKGYTRKQWGIDPRELPASVLKRLPVRFSYDDNYYSDTFQGIPGEGYTELVRNILDSDRIEVCLNTSFEETDREEFSHVFYTGRIDRFFGYRFGVLPYRTLDFEHFHPPGHLGGDFQGCAVMNYCDESVPFTRVVEHRHFTPGEHYPGTICSREFSRECGPGDIPFYPVRLAEGDAAVERYLSAAEKEKGVTFAGRLGTNRYLDMDDAVAAALQAADAFLESPG